MTPVKCNVLVLLSFGQLVKHKMQLIRSQDARCTFAIDHVRLAWAAADVVETLTQKIAES